MRNAAHALLARDGVGVSVIYDSVGFVAQRVLAMIVNLIGDIVQHRIASVEDLDEGGLGAGLSAGAVSLGRQCRYQTLAGHPRAHDRVDGRSALLAAPTRDTRLSLCHTEPTLT